MNLIRLVWHSVIIFPSICFQLGLWFQIFCLSYRCPRECSKTCFIHVNKAKCQLLFKQNSLSSLKIFLAYPCQRILEKNKKRCSYEISGSLTVFGCRREIRISLCNGHIKSKTITRLQCVTIILEQLGFEFVLKITEKNAQDEFFQCRVIC